MKAKSSAQIGAFFYPMFAKCYFMPYYKIWKQTHPLKWVRFFTRCLPIGLTLKTMLAEMFTFLNVKICFYQIVANFPYNTTETVKFPKTFKIRGLSEKYIGFFEKES